MDQLRDLCIGINVSSSVESVDLRRGMELAPVAMGSGEGVVRGGVSAKRMARSRRAEHQV